jgi:hypothetical protein
MSLWARGKGALPAHHVLHYALLRVMTPSFKRRKDSLQFDTSCSRPPCPRCETETVQGQASQSLPLKHG